MSLASNPPIAATAPPSWPAPPLPWCGTDLRTRRHHRVGRSRGRGSAGRAGQEPCLRAADRRVGPAALARRTGGPRSQCSRLGHGQGILAGLGAIDADVVVSRVPPRPAPSRRRASSPSAHRTRPWFRSVLVATKRPTIPGPTSPGRHVLGGAPAGRANADEAWRGELRWLSVRARCWSRPRPRAAEGGKQIIEALIEPHSLRRRLRHSGDRRARFGGRDQAHRHRNAGKIAIYPEAEPAAERQIWPAPTRPVRGQGQPSCTNRRSGKRYGVLPLVPDCAAYRDYVVDYDVASQTGNGLLTSRTMPTNIRRLFPRGMLRADPDVWQPLQRLLMRTAPRWESTAALFEGLCLSQPASA